MQARGGIRGVAVARVPAAEETFTAEVPDAVDNAERVGSEPTEKRRRNGWLLSPSQQVAVS
jgi:hypothetical protein